MITYVVIRGRIDNGASIEQVNSAEIAIARAKAWRNSGFSAFAHEVHINTETGEVKYIPLAD